MAGNPGSDNAQVHEKPCRACTDFKTWAKGRKKGKENPEFQEDLQSPNQEGQEHKDSREKKCPLTRDELGNHSWNFLHTMAAHYPEKPTETQRKEVHEFYRLFSRFYPCNVCAEDFQRQIERFPPKTESQHELSQWLCRVHNRVNLRLGKELFDCASVNERWKDGWSDGSCN